MAPSGMIIRIMCKERLLRNVTQIVVHIKRLIISSIERIFLITTSSSSKKKTSNSPS